MINLLHNGDNIETGILIINLISSLISLATTALVYVSRWFIFQKLGLQGWEGIVPYYSDYKLYKTVWKTKPFWAIVIASGVYVVTVIISTILLIVFYVFDPYDSAAYVFVFAALFVLLTIALVTIAIVISVKMSFRLARAFGKGTGFALGLAFLSVIFYPILAFGNSQRVQ